MDGHKNWIIDKIDILYISPTLYCHTVLYDTMVFEFGIFWNLQKIHNHEKPLVDLTFENVLALFQSSIPMVIIPNSLQL